MRHRKVHPVEKKSFYEVMDKSIADTEMQIWGWDFICDLYKCDLKKMDDEENIKNFLNELVKELKMEAVGEPIIKRFGKEKIRDLSALLLITTSNVSVHCDQASKLNRVFIDIFSCKEYNPSLVLPLVKKYFDPEKIASIFILRSGHHIKVVHNY